MLLVGVLLVLVGSPPAPSQPEHISVKLTNTTQVIHIAPIITKGYSISYGNTSAPRSRHLHITCFLLSDNTEVDIYTQLLYYLKHERRLPMSIPTRCHNKRHFMLLLLLSGIELNPGLRPLIIHAEFVKKLLKIWVKELLLMTIAINSAINHV